MKGRQPEAGSSPNITYSPKNLILAALLTLAVVMAVGYLRWLDGVGDGIGGDFRATTYEPGNAILDGRSPYPEPESVSLDSLPAAYPPPYMLLFAPLSVLPFQAATGLWLAALAAAITVALWLVGLRDVRCYAIALLSLPVVAAVGHGNATGLLMLSTALLWRWRDRTHYGAAAFACGLLIKPILWPVFVWLLVTRRVRLALEASVLAPLAALAGWAIIGFDDLAEYPALLRAISDAAASNGLLATNLLLDLGLPLRAAEFVSVMLGACLLFASIRIRSDVDRFTLAVAAALVITPVMWSHYFVLLFVPLAARSARLSAAWFAVLPLWLVAPAYEWDGTRAWWTSVVGMVFVVAVLAPLVRRESRVEPAGLTAGP